MTSPNGGEVWEAGTYQQITWESTDAEGLVEVSLLRNGQLHDRIGRTRMSWEELSWTVCDLVGDGANYAVRVASMECDPPVEDVSDAAFEITGAAPPPTLTVTSPNGGEFWPAGSTQTITWNSTDPSGYVAVWLLKIPRHLRSLDLSTTPMSVPGMMGEPYAFLGHVPMADGTFTWDICRYLDAGPGYSVRLTWFDHCGPSVEDWSDTVFAITGSSPPPTLTVTSPNGGEVWLADSIQTVTWDSTDPTGSVEVWLTDGGTRYDYIGSTRMADGHLDWPIPPCLEDGTDCQVLVRWSDYPLDVEDLSDDPFEIAGSSTPDLTITSPTGGDVWAAGSTQTITWDSTCANGMADLYVSYSGYSDVFNVHLGRVPVSAGSFDWELCPGFGDLSECEIHLAMNECATSVVSGSFDIDAGGFASPTLELISPAEGEEWAAGTPHTITWESANLGGDVIIDVPEDMDHHWGRAVVPVSDGSFVWPIAPIPPGGTSVRIRSYDCGDFLEDKRSITITAGTTPFGDLDGDGDVDLRDFAGFQVCFTDNVPALLGPICDSFDREPDGDVDLSDYNEMSAEFSGP